MRMPYAKFLIRAHLFFKGGAGGNSFNVIVIASILNNVVFNFGAHNLISCLQKVISFLLLWVCMGNL